MPGTVDSVPPSRQQEDPAIRERAAEHFIQVTDLIFENELQICSSQFLASCTRLR
ncbi:hypothetical protein [Actinoplanes regularis]|uniref:hypothetical protein n=1 Tax=Actinoplanes regularis TaxID=52697 RepID=UPI0025565D48|nr:hypothetical protein [Actinoplanes regularis]